MKIAPPAHPGREPSLREQHERRCFLWGFTEAWQVEQLWREQLDRLERAKTAGAEPRPGGRHGREG